MAGSYGRSLGELSHLDPYSMHRTITLHTNSKQDANIYSMLGMPKLNQEWSFV
jgi:hypothetical protein